MSTILVLPDAHAAPGISNDRFKWLGNYIVKHQPDIVVNLGDMCSVDSLCKYDVGTLKAEGRRYVDDIASAKSANRALFKPLHKYNNTHTAWKKKTYRPWLYLTLGNHENRINRAAAEDPKYYGHLKVSDLGYEKAGWSVVPWGSTLALDGIAFKHYFTSGIMGRPISGEHHAASLIKKNFVSSVAAHTHCRGFEERTSALGKKLFGLVAGCYFEHEEEYTNENDRWWRGVVILHGAKDGEADPEFVSIQEIKREFA